MKLQIKRLFFDARPKNKNYNTFHSKYRIFESLLFEGYSCKCLQTLHTY
jgi:hypothetical protein